MSEQYKHEDTADTVFEYRPALSEDAVAITALTAQAVAARQGSSVTETEPAADSIERVAGLLNQPSTWSRLVIAADGKIIGCAFGYPKAELDSGQPPARREHLDMLMVSPRQWGHNIGGTLLDWVANHLRDKDVAVVDLWTEASNVRARGLYERKDYRHTDRQRLHPESGEAQVHYELNL